MAHDGVVFRMKDDHALHTTREIDLISEACFEVEAEHGVPFPDRNPNHTDKPAETPKPRSVRFIPDEGGNAPQEKIDALRHTISALPDRQRAFIAEFTKQATAARCGISIRQNPTVRRCAIAAMLVDLVRLDDTELMQAVLTTHNPSTDTTETLGAQIGRLSTDDALQVATLAHAVFDGSAKITISDNGFIIIGAENQPNPTTKGKTK